MTDLRCGTVAFLFTDVEESTARWERDRAAMGAATGAPRQCGATVLGIGVRRYG